MLGFIRQSFNILRITKTDQVFRKLAPKESKRSIIPAGVQYSGGITVSSIQSRFFFFFLSNNCNQVVQPSKSISCLAITKAYMVYPRSKKKIRHIMVCLAQINDQN